MLNILSLWYRRASLSSSWTVLRRGGFQGIAIAAATATTAWRKERLERVGNRMTIGLVLAALIVGTAMLTRVETTFLILGYPVLAVFFFLLAAAGGVALLASMLFFSGRRRR